MNQLLRIVFNLERTTGQVLLVFYCVPYNWTERCGHLVLTIKERPHFCCLPQNFFVFFFFDPENKIDNDTSCWRLFQLLLGPGPSNLVVYLTQRPLLRLNWRPKPRKTSKEPHLLTHVGTSFRTVLRDTQCFLSLSNRVTNHLRRVESFNMTGSKTEIIFRFRYGRTTHSIKTEDPRATINVIAWTAYLALWSSVKTFNSLKVVICQ